MPSLRLAGEALQRLAAVLARLAVGNAKVDQLAAAEQRQVARGQRQRPSGNPGPRPAPRARPPWRFMARIASAASSTSSGSFAVEDIERRQRLVELGRELLGAQAGRGGVQSGLVTVSSRRSNWFVRSRSISR